MGCHISESVYLWKWKLNCFTWPSWSLGWSSPEQESGIFIFYKSSLQNSSSSMERNWKRKKQLLMNYCCRRAHQKMKVGSLSLSFMKVPFKTDHRPWKEIESKKNKYWWSIAIEGLTRRWRLGPSWSGRRPPRWSRCAPWPWPPWTWAQGVELNWIELNWQIISKIWTVPWAH